MGMGKCLFINGYMLRTDTYAVFPPSSLDMMFCAQGCCWEWTLTYFSSSLSFSPSNSSSHPTSIRTLTPPSSSSSDCDADDSDWAPRREQKVNMSCCWPDCPRYEVRCDSAVQESSTPGRSKPIHRIGLCPVQCEDGRMILYENGRLWCCGMGWDWMGCVAKGTGVFEARKSRPRS